MCICDTSNCHVKNGLYAFQVISIFLVLNGINVVGASPTLPLTNATSDPDVPVELFHWQDYLVLATMLLVSCAIGVFYGYFGEAQTTSDDFLLGGSSMGTFPMALSLAARYVAYSRETCN